MVAAVVLAAGEGSRFGGPKQRLLLPEVLARLARARLDEVVVVAGAHPVETSVPVIYCQNWQQGAGASLRCGLAALAEPVEAAVVLLADGPDLAPEAIDRVVQAWRAGTGDVLAATYDGRTRSHPVLLARAAWGRVPDEGGRALQPVLVSCEDLEAPGDVDVPGDLPGRLRRAEREV